MKHVEIFLPIRENRSSDIVWSETIAPSYAAIEYHDSGVWDKLESFEDEYAIERFPKNIGTLKNIWILRVLR